jgi:hypothetical protein
MSVLGLLNVCSMVESETDKMKRGFGVPSEDASTLVVVVPWPIRH